MLKNSDLIGRLLGERMQIVNTLIPGWMRFFGKKCNLF